MTDEGRRAVSISFGVVSAGLGVALMALGGGWVGLVLLLAGACSLSYEFAIRRDR